MKTLIASTLCVLFLCQWSCRAQSKYIKGGPQSGNHTVIIFIHGYLGSNASWNSLKSASVTLPAMISTDPDLSKFADVYLFEYLTEANNAKSELPPTIAGRLGDEAFAMHKAGKTNIILVCHSMGGLVAWSYLDQTATFQIMERPVKTIITLATPYEGTELGPAPFAALISPNPQVYALLKKGKNSYLDGLSQKYARSSSQKQIDTFCAYETAPMALYGMVVSKQSATAFCSPEHQQPIRGDHSQIVRPESPAFPENFSFVKAAILNSSQAWLSR